jgi:hypothetical protein
MKREATPEIKNNRLRRHGELNIIKGSMAVLAAWLLTWKSQVT